MVIEGAVLDRIVNVLLDARNVERLVELTNQELKESGSSARDRASAITHRLEDVQKRLGRLYEALETGKLQIEDLAPRIQTLRQEERSLVACEPRRRRLRRPHVRRWSTGNWCSLTSRF